MIKDSRKITGRLATVGILAVGIGGFVLLRVLAPQPVVTPREETLPLVEVASLVWEEVPFEIRGEGVVRPRTTVSVAAQVTGEVLQTGAGLERGGAFEKGEMLVQIDPRPYAAAVRQLEGDILALQADLKYAIQQVARLEDLRSSNVASESDLEQQISVRGRLQGQIVAREAQLLRSQLDLAHAKIVAPFAGKAFSREVDIGDVVQPGTPLAEIFATDLYEIVVQLDDDEAAMIPGIWDLDSRDEKIAAQVEASFGAGTYSWSAVLASLEGVLDRDTRTMNAVVHVPDPGRLGQQVAGSGSSTPPLLPGMYASVRLEGLSAGITAVVPRAALQPGPFVWTLDSESKLRALPVAIAFTRDEDVAVTAAKMPAGRSVVVTQMPAATEGMRVRAQAGSKPILDE
jgi:RND family efflux transporter MFP subunit